MTMCDFNLNLESTKPVYAKMLDQILIYQLSPLITATHMKPCWTFDWLGWYWHVSGSVDPLPPAKEFGAQTNRQFKANARVEGIVIGVGSRAWKVMIAFDVHVLGQRPLEGRGGQLCSIETDNNPTIQLSLWLLQGSIHMTVSIVSFPV